MATLSDAQAVKSLNQSPGRKRFIFKTFSQQVEEIEINVYRSLNPLKFELSEGSSFFHGCLIQWRELNTAEDFISFYEEMLPFVQTLPQIILQKEMIISKLISRLQMKGRLSLEPILRLIAALSRDLLEDFLPFLGMIADSLFSLLKSGADREPEIIEQIFTSWSYMMMYLRKYLTGDIVQVLKVAGKLRYYPKDYIQEFMAESVSFLLRNSPIDQLRKGIRKVMFEVVKEPSVTRRSGVSALLHYVLKGTSARLHSKAEKVLRLLMDSSTFCIGDKVCEGSVTINEVIVAAFRRLCDELEAKELCVVWDCLNKEITDCANNGHLLHLGRLLALLVSTIQDGYARKVSGHEVMLQLVRFLVQTFIVPSHELKEGGSSEVIDNVLQLMLCTLDCLNMSNNISVLSCISSEWAAVFKLKNSSLLRFIKELLLKEASILCKFRTNIISALHDFIGSLEEEVVFLLLILSERLQDDTPRLLDGIPKEKLSRISNFFQEAICYWIGVINDAVQSGLHIQIPVNKLAFLWGVIFCYPYTVNAEANPSLLMDLVDALDGFTMIESESAKAHLKSLIGATLTSYHKLLFFRKVGDIGPAAMKYLYFAKKYHSCSQILSAVSDFLDSEHVSMIQDDVSYKICRPEISAGRMVDVLDVFAKNLSHLSKEIRLFTLRILRHYKSIKREYFLKDQPLEDIQTEDNQASHVGDQGCDVLQLLLSIESSPLSITTSRKVILLISRIQMGLSASRIPEKYVASALYGILGIFHNRFSQLWNPASECVAILISQYVGMVWDKYIQYLEECMSLFLTSQDTSDGPKNELSNLCGDLVARFDLTVTAPFDSTPSMTVLSFLIQSLQRVLSVVESRSRQIVSLFLTFLGYNDFDTVSVNSYNSKACKGKQWKGVLKEWLNLFRLMRNPRSLYRSEFLKEVLQYRLLDENDGELQTRVLDCLCNRKDDFLLPYDLHLRNLICTKSLREELTTWRLSRESNFIDKRHRTHLVPIVIRILIPKVRKLKALASRKHASVHLRKAVLGFLAQLDNDELPLFFALLVKPLQYISDGVDATSSLLWNSPEKPYFDSSNMLKHFTVDHIKALSWKKRYGFLHVIEDILGVFDEFHVNPFLDLLMGCVVRILGSCTICLDSTESSGVCKAENFSSFKPSMKGDNCGEENGILTNTAVKQFKELRSLCLKILSLALDKYEDHDFSFEFWELFFDSVKSLIDAFKQEGASSEKPSSLFSCFLAMSRSYKLVPLLGREKNLVSDIFSMLMVTTASNGIISCVFNFIENLLDLDSKIDGEDDTVKSVLLPHLDVLVYSLHYLFANNATKRKLVKYPGERELCVFKLLSKYVKDTCAARKFVDILLPLLAKGTNDLDACIEILQVFRRIIKALGSESTEKILNAFSLLLVSAGLDVRMSICDVLDALADNDSSMLSVAKLLRDLNATSAMEVGGLDYDIIIAAYGKINVDFFYNVREAHALIILSHSLHHLSSEELILRQSAYRLLLSFVEFCGDILDRELEPENCSWSRARIRNMITNFLLKHMGVAMKKETSVQKVWIDLLRDMVLKLPKVTSLASYRALCSEDVEQDFFNNITHLQKHRRARALIRFTNVISSCNLSEVITNKVFVPLLFNILFDDQYSKTEHLRNACLDALASIAGQMEWKKYYALLVTCFREMRLKPDKQKLLLRLICSILDHFHFSGTYSAHEGKDSAEVVSNSDSMEMNSPTTLEKCNSSARLSDIQACLNEKMLPKIQKLLSSPSDNVNVNVSLVALKLLKLLPGDIMELQLPNIIHRISNFLKSRLESLRDDARSALVACMKELGLEYLKFIVDALRGTLKRGYELHVLGYTVNFILSKCLPNITCGKLDYCLEELLSVAKSDILGDVSEEKEVEKIASKMKETRKNKSFETLKFIAQSVTFKTHALKLVSPVTVHLQKHLTPKVKSKLENMLNHIAAGIEVNPSVTHTDLFIFAHGIITDGIMDEKCKHETSSVPKPSKSIDEVCGEMVDTGKMIKADPRCSHLYTVFALGLMQNRLKNIKLEMKDERILSMLDPFVGVLVDCLNSKYENVISAALGCLSPLVRLPLPSFEIQADKIKTSLLVIAQGSVSASTPLTESCLRLLTVLLRNTRVTLSSDQLHMLIQFPLFVDLKKNSSFLALSLLKAIVKQKLVVYEIYDVVNSVAELMVTSQEEPIRKKCSQILLQFLLDYSLSEKRLQQHLDFLFENLSYEHSTGREAVLEMLHAIIIKFPKSVLDKQSRTMFVYLVACLANDHDHKVRSMTATALKLLVGHALGLLVEVLKKEFQSHISIIMKKDYLNHISIFLPQMRSILHLAASSFGDRKVDLSDEPVLPFWKEAYYSLVMLEKILHQFPESCLERDLEGIWEAICDFMLYPHVWLRNISNRLIAFYFKTVTAASRESHEKTFGRFFLMRPDRLFLIAVSLCYQLKANLTYEAANDLISQNLVCAICGLHFLGQDEYKIWSTHEKEEQGCFLNAIHMLDSRKGGSMFASLTAGLSVGGVQEQREHRHMIISYLLRKLGKVALQKEDVQLKIVFNSFKLISPKILHMYQISSPIGEEDSLKYTYQMLLPLYKVCEGFAGKFISDDVKQLAQEACESIRNTIGMQSFVQVYGEIRKNLKAKRDKRKQEEKLMAVINPMRNAKRKLRIAEKHRANKKRKMVSIKFGRWVR